MFGAVSGLNDEPDRELMENVCAVATGLVDVEEMNGVIVVLADCDIAGDVSVLRDGLVTL